uniref:Interleukin n=1 Tax=Cynoglossus semilaevis TaxID=244447 RepID=A0A3P8X525_CYNSE
MVCTCATRQEANRRVPGKINGSQWLGYCSREGNGYGEMVSGGPQGEKLLKSKSDAMLYTPSFDYTNVMILNCYMLELTMVLDEEEVPLDDYSKSIYSFSKQFEKQTNIQTAIGCLRCEAYSLQNITIFLDRLKDFLQRMASDPKGNV